MERYEYLSTLSSGAYGVVYKVLDRVSGRICATKGIKQAHEDAEVLRLTLREVKVLKALPPHPNVVTLVEAFRSQSGRVYLVFEFVERSLHEEMHRHPGGALPGPMLKSVAWQLLHALEHCHFHNVVHRDVKPANVLLTGYTRGVGGGGVVKLCDFGFARPVIPPAPHPPGRGETEPRVAHGRDGGEGLAMSSYVMTRWYRPPEVLVGDMYGTPIDVWSFGCTLAELASGKPLFPGRSTVDQIWRILRCLGPLPLSQTACLREDRRLAPLWGSPPPVTRSLRQLLPDVEPRLLQLITACLTLDPRKRPTVRQLLEQPYFWDVRSLLAGTDVGAQLPYINGPADLRCTITRPAVNARAPADATMDAADGARALVAASSGKPDRSTAQAATEIKATGADARAVGESGAAAQRPTAATDGGTVFVAASVASEASAIPLPGCRPADANANGTPCLPAPEARPPATVTAAATAAAAAAAPAAGVSITALSGDAKDDPTSSITAACEAATSHSTAPTEAVSELMPGGSGGGGGGGAAASGAWPRNLPPSLLRPPPVLLGPGLPWAARVADEAVGLSTVADSLLTSGENTASSGGQAAAAVAPAAAAASDGVSTLEASERSQHGRVAKSVADVAAAAEAPGSPFRIPYANFGSGPGGIASPVGITAAAAAAGMAGTRPAAVGAMSPPLRASIDLMCLGSPAGAPALSTYLDRNAPLPHRRGPALPQDSLVLGSPVGTAPGSPIATTAPNNSEGLVGGARTSHVEAIQVLEHVASEAGKSEAQMLNTGVSVAPLHLLSHQSTSLSIQAGQAGGAAGGGLGTAVSGINSSTSNAYQHTLRWLGSHGVAAGPSSRAGGTIVELEAADTTALAAAAAAPPLAVASVDVHSVAGNVGGGGMGGGVSNGGSFFAVGGGGGGGGDVSSVWGSEAGTQTPPSAAVAEAGTVARRSWLHITSWTPGGGGGAANGGGGGGSNGGGGGTGGGGGSAVIRSWGRLRGVHGGASEGGMAPGRATSTPLGVGSCSQVPVTLTGAGTGGGVHGSQPGPPSHLTHHQAQLEPRCHHSGPSAPHAPHAPHGHGANAQQGATPQHVHLHQHTHTHQHQHVHVHHVHHYQQPPQDRHAQALAVALAQAQSCAAAAAAAAASGPGTPVTSGAGGRGNSGGCMAGGSPRGGDAGGSGAQAASPLSPAGLLALRLHSGSNGEGRTSRGRYSVDDDVRRSAATAAAAAAAAVSGNGPRSVSQVELLRSGGAPAEHDQLEPAAAGQPRSPTEPCSVPNRLPMRPPGCGPLSVDQHGRVQAASELVSSTSWGCLPRAKARVVTHNRNGYVSARGGSSSGPAHPARLSAWRRLFCGLVGGGNGDQPNGLDSSSSDSATRKRFSAQPRRSSSSGDSLGPVTPRSKQLQRQLLQLQSSQMKLSSQEQTSTVSASPCGWSSRLEGAASCAPANGSSGESGFRRNSNSNTCDPFGAAEGMAATGSAGSAQATVPRQKELGTGRQSASGALACTSAASNTPVTEGIPIQFVETGLQASVACMLPAAGHQATATHRLPGPPPASFDQPEEK